MLSPLTVLAANNVSVSEYLRGTIEISSWLRFNFNDFAFSFLSVLLEGIPFLLLGSIISGFVDVFVSSERISRLLPRNNAAAIFISGLLGLVFPMCECGSVIVIRRFIRKGLPLASAVSYMLAAPIVSPIVAFSTFAAFKGQRSPTSVLMPGASWWDRFFYEWEYSIMLTVLRLAIGYAIACGVAFIVSRIRAESILQSGVATGAPRTGLRVAATPGGQEFSQIVETASFPKKLLLAVQSATADLLDVAFFLIIGAAIASVFNTAVRQEFILPFAENPPVAIIALMLLAVALSLCSTTDAFIAATFATFPAAAKLAFLLFGPLFDLKLFWLYGVLFKRRFVLALGAGLFAVIFLVCWRIGAIGVFD